MHVAVVMQALHIAHVPDPCHIHKGLMGMQTSLPLLPLLLLLLLLLMLLLHDGAFKQYITRSMRACRSCT